LSVVTVVLSSLDEWVAVGVDGRRGHVLQKWIETQLRAGLQPGPVPTEFVGPAIGGVVGVKFWWPHSTDLIAKPRHHAPRPGLNACTLASRPLRHDPVLRCGKPNALANLALIDDEGLSARIGADHLGHAQVSMTQDRYMSRGRVHVQVAELLDRTVAINDE
jgi:hypothetical protein